AVDAAGNRSLRTNVYVTTASCPQQQTQSQSTSTQPQAATAPSADGWTFCANEHDRCAFTGAKEVRYGVTGSYTSPRTFTDGVSCSNDVFGDPIPGTVKHCDARSAGSTPPPPPAPSPSDWTFCANEHQRCAFTGAKEVHYGVTGTFTAPRTFTDGVSCSNGVFGDPIKGTVK